MVIAESKFKVPKTIIFFNRTKNQNLPFLFILYSTVFCDYLENC